VLADLRAEGLVTDHQLVASHTVTMTPGLRPHHRAVAGRGDRRRGQTLAAAGVYSRRPLRRWTYCSIEDNLIETQELAAALGPLL
jgi:hypothetical protein